MYDDISTKDEREEWKHVVVGSLNCMWSGEILFEGRLLQLKMSIVNLRATTEKVK